MNPLGLVKSEYELIRKVLDTVEVKGVENARALSLLAAKLEHRVATWFDGHPTGFEQEAPPVPAILQPHAAGSATGDDIPF